MIQDRMVFMLTTLLNSMTSDGLVLPSPDTTTYVRIALLTPKMFTKSRTEPLEYPMMS